MIRSFYRSYFFSFVHHLFLILIQSFYYAFVNSLHFCKLIKFKIYQRYSLVTIVFNKTLLFFNHLLLAL